MEENLVKLNSAMAYALCQHPENVGIVLDEEGWVPVEELLATLRKRNSWQNISTDDFVAIIMQSEEKRYEMSGGMIRAYYGHPIPPKEMREPTIPPEILFHGTTRNAALAIKKEGIKPMQRQYVHLSDKKALARTVALCKTPYPVILRVEALQAHQQGIKFYYGNDMVWLADTIPPRFIHFLIEE